MSFATPPRVACEVIGPARHEWRSGAPSASRRHRLFDGCCASDQRISARSPRGLLPVKNCETFREQPLVGRRHGSASPLSCVCGLFTLIPRGAAAPRPLRVGKKRRKKARRLNDECWAQISKLVGEGRRRGGGAGNCPRETLKPASKCVCVHFVTCAHRNVARARRAIRSCSFPPGLFQFRQSSKT